MTEAILRRDPAVSFVVIVIIMAVMANTMAMTARERYAEYATLKALGFGPGFVALLIFGESSASRSLGGGARHRADVPGGEAFGERDGHAVPGVLRFRARRSRCRSALRSSVGVVAAGVPGVARGARAHRRRPARGRVSGDAWRSRSRYIARNLVGAQRLTPR